MDVPEITITADTEVEINPKIEASSNSEDNENAKHGNDRGSQDNLGNIEAKNEQKVKVAINSGTNDLPSNKKVMNPTDSAKLPVNEGQFYFKAWPSPQERQEESKFYDGDLS